MIYPVDVHSVADALLYADSEAAAEAEAATRRVEVVRLHALAEVLHGQIYDHRKAHQACRSCLSEAARLLADRVPTPEIPGQLDMFGGAA